MTSAIVIEKKNTSQETVNKLRRKNSSYKRKPLLL